MLYPRPRRSLINKLLGIVVFTILSWSCYGQLPGIPIGGPGVPGGGGGVPGPPDIPDNFFYEYPNPYANKAVSYRSIYLYTQEELDAFITGGKIIYGISFDVINRNGAPLRNFTISIAEVDYDEIPATGVNENFKQVYFRNSFTENDGNNVHEFSQPYCYDSGKNLLIQVCVQNQEGEMTQNAGVNTSFPDSVKYYSWHDWSNNSVYLCDTVTSNGQRYLNRPIISFYANPIGVNDFITTKAENPSGLEFVGSVHIPKITIRNFSCNSYSGYEIGYQVEGQQANREYPGITMTKNETRSFTFQNPVTLDKPGFKIIKYWVNNPNDINRNNDTITRLIWVRKDQFEGLDYTGTDFWVGYMQNFSNPASLEQKIFITSIDTANVTVSLPSLGWSQTVSVLPFDVKTVDVPVNYGGYTIACDQVGVRQPIGIRVSSDKEISVYVLSNAPQSSDAYLAIPTPSLGREYYSIAPVGTFFAAEVGETTEEELPAEILLIGTEDSTVAEVVLSAPANGKQKGDTITTLLNAGETYLIKAEVERTVGIPTNTFDLTGSKITSNHKIGVIGGSQCATVPGFGQQGACQYCDHIMEQQTPATSWGNSYYLTDFAFKPGDDIVRIVSGDYPSTTVNVGGTVYVLNGAGDYVDHKFQGELRILATNPIQVVQMCTGGQCAPRSSTDPFFINALPDVQWGSNYTFSTVISPTFPLHYINVVKRAKVGRVAIDGNMINQGLFKKVGNTDYYAAKIRVSEGTHMVTSDTTISVSVYGFGLDDGYGFPGSGAKLKPVNTPPPVLTTSKEDVSCFGYKDGSITAVGSEGTPPYIFIWDDGFIGDTRDSLDVGTYVVTMLDDYGFSERDTIVILQPDTFIVSTKADSISCFGLADGRAEAVIKGGVEPYNNPRWNTGETALVLENLSSELLWYEVSDAEGCRAADTVLIPQPDPLYFNAVVKQISCFGKQDGRIDLYPSGGNGAYNIIFLDESGNPSGNRNLKEGFYDIHITDQKGCSADTTVEIIMPERLTLDINTLPSGCYDAATGRVFLNGKGGTGDYQYALEQQGYSLDSIFNGLKKGKYDVYIRDENGCFYNQVADVPTVPIPDFEIAIQADHCSQKMGEATLQGSGGTEPYNAEWVMDGDTLSGNEISGLGEGVYTVIARDQNCKEQIEFTVTDYKDPEFTFDLTPPHCGLNNGKIVFDVTQYTSYYNLKSFLGQPFDGDSLNNLTPGTYYLQVSDSLCSVDTVVKVNRIPDLEIDYSIIEPERCDTANGSAQVFARGGKGSYSYQWQTSPRVDSNYLGGKRTGSYEIQVSDTFCTKSFNIFIPKETSPKLFVNTEPTHCDADNGWIRVSIAGGSGNNNFYWEEFPEINDGYIENLDSGTYHLRYTDGYCVVNKEISVGRVNDFSISTQSTPTHCDLNIGEAEIIPNPQGSYIYRWIGNPENTSNQIGGLDSGWISFEVENENCIFKDSILVSKVPNPEISAVSNEATCEEANGQVILSGNSSTGQFTFTDSTGSTVSDTVKGLWPGLHTFTINDGYCATSGTFRVHEIEAPKLNPDLTPESCGNRNGSIQASPTGLAPFSIVWADNFSNGFNRYNLSAGVYPYAFTDGRCTMLDTVILENKPTSPLILQTSKLDATCGENNGYLKIEVSGEEAPYLISWNKPEMGNKLEHSNLAPGVYFLTVAGAICKETVPFVIKDLPPLTVETEVIKNADCGENSGQVLFNLSNVTGSAELDMGSEVITSFDTLKNLGPGNHSYTVYDEMCAVQGSFNIPIGSDLKYTIYSFPEKCNQQDGEIEVVPTQFSSLLDIVWDDGNKDYQRTGLKAGAHSFTISDSLCSYSRTVNLINGAAPQGKINVLRSEACNQKDGGAEFVNRVGVNSFVWSNGISNQTVNNTLTAGVVRVTATNQFCVREFVDTIPFTYGPVMSPVVVPEYCQLDNGQILFNPWVESSHHPYLFKNNITGEVFSQDYRLNLNAGTYSYTLTDSRGCSNTWTGELGEEITQLLGGKIYTLPDPPVVGSEVILSSSLPQDWSNYLWVIGGDTLEGELPRHTLRSDSTLIKLLVKHSGGCIDEVSLLAIADKQDLFFLPNSFSPDGDGINDRYYPVAEDILSWKGQIFNRWGELVYSFTHADEPWDGTYLGQLVDNGIYPVKFTYIRTDGTKGFVDGMVTVLR
ncbi:T9SS type B sorting domain-containing protein [Luteibaculum oceani]|uniref:T9SS type B sorting domain-containing protein n=1 Tax=Luteibaculum oceani TaxID=1294296 RepID=A0A5C6VJM8_9FLAO|nr:gliding motility-associated C-terminal domain-containing protein [Luteibaculum oceani]TXC85150.1 T9SS type B sorting domain-containing protein [Luteibaculum oceani]